MLEVVQRENLDLAIISDPKNIFYLTGFASSAILFLPTYLLIFKDGSSKLVTGATDSANAQKTFGGEVETFVNYDLRETMLAYPDLASNAVKKILDQHSNNLRRIGIETWSCPQVVFQLLSKHLSDSQFFDLSLPLQNFRMTKDSDEIENIRRSCELDDLAYSVAKKNSNPGATEVDIYGLAQYELAKRVGSFQFFSGNFTSGERNLDPMGSGEPTMRVMKRGETIVLDLWVTTNGYWADTCRTFVVGGQPTEQQLRVHRILLQALEAGEKMLRPGIRAGEVYDAIWGKIAEAGWGSYFPHHAGHSVGLDAWERPFIIPGSKDILGEGMVCALEPGVYIPDVGGIRIENDYLITRDSAESLSRFPLDL
ncbi:MAG: Xaa-Pro peptidase family protein [Thaumarchaeota archaeon]|nr:Xaa-Pro peptidase family protein [Nitrososphaerota archaeon]